MGPSLLDHRDAAPTGAAPGESESERGATIGGAGCLGRLGEIGELSIGAVGDIAVWSLEGPQFAGVVDDPVEGWLRCGPASAKHTIVHGRAVVRDHQLVSPKLGAMLRDHERLARRMQRASS